MMVLSVCVYTNVYVYYKSILCWVPHLYVYICSRLCVSGDTEVSPAPLSICSVLQDWWMCVDFQTFYHKWNHLMYDWIHAYIYRDLRVV